MSMNEEKIYLKAIAGKNIIKKITIKEKMN